MKKVFFLFTMLCVGSVLAQTDKPAAPTAPAQAGAISTGLTLKDSVAAPILKLQKQELALQVQYTNVDRELGMLMSSAIKDSGLDPNKYEVKDWNTLQVGEISSKK